MSPSRQLTTVDRSELLEAFEWVSANVPFENAAYICQRTGRIYWIGEGVEEAEDFPKDIDDGSRYVAVPHKHDLGVGKPLALRFSDEHLPSESHRVRAFFSRPGAYGRFKNLLERFELLDRWHEFESSRVEAALEAWASDNGFLVEVRTQRDDA
jgi:hypothetical protein